MIQEFKEFIQRGNVLDFAVAVILATAFGTVVTSFTQDVVFPPIGQMMGGVDFSELKYVLQEGSLAADGSEATAEVAIRWGQFVNHLINFIIVSFVMFLIVKAYNNATNKVDEEPGPTSEELLAEIRDALTKNA